MGATMVERIIGGHAGTAVRPGDIVDVLMDARIARDFGGANVVKNLRDHGLSIADPSKTFFTLDCNPGGSDQKYAANQQICRTFAREHGIKVYDIDKGIGTHIAIDEGLVGPGGTLVSTDSHANILGAVGAFGQGMGDLEVAYAFANGRVWFKVPPTIKVVLNGKPGRHATAKDIALRLLKEFGANGLLGYSAEFHGEGAERMSLADRMTVSSMVTEMGGILGLFPPNEEVLEHFRAIGAPIKDALPDADAVYEKVIAIDLDGLAPMISLPGHPEDVVPVSKVAGTKVGSVFIGSCTNGRYEDMKAAAKVLNGKKVAAGVVLKIVPSTQGVWRRCLKEGIIRIFTDAGALIGNPGCAGCAAGQIGQNGEGEVTVSTGNRNFAGKQGKGEVYLASPETAAATAVAGVITAKGTVPEALAAPPPKARDEVKKPPLSANREPPVIVRGRAWVILRDNIDTDMIFHNSHLTITDIKEMGQHAFGNLEGYRDFAIRARPGDILIVGRNFGCGSSRQQAVDCFISLGIGAVIASSFGAIYERNAMNAGFPVLTADTYGLGIKDGDEVEADMEKGLLRDITSGKDVRIDPFFPVQMEIYRRGGLLGPR